MKRFRNNCTSFNHKNFLQSEYFSFFGGGLLGIILFLFLYGTSTLDVTNVDWLLQKNDLSQHYFGWSFYRNSDWLFPIGLANTLSYPLTSSVIYTDSIPILAVFFKLFRDILPESFQYFGWFVFIVYFLQGAISALLVHRLTGNAYYGILSAILFLLSTPLFCRTFNHTALSAHFLLLLSLLILLTRRYIERTWRGIAIWSFILFLSASTHFFFMPMVGCCLLLYAIKVKLSNPKWWPSLATLFIPLVVAFTEIWLLGGLTSDVTTATQTSGHPYMLRSASANFNSFINPLGTATLFPFNHLSLATAKAFQYEGYCYLGAGILIGLPLLLLIIIIHTFRGKIDFKHSNVWMILTLATIFFLLSLSPDVTYNEKVLFSVPLWHPLEKIWTIFRATGRFIWMPAYILILVLVVGTYRFNKKWKGGAFGLLILLVGLQIADRLPWMKHEADKKIAATYCKMKDYDKLDKLVDNHPHICFSIIQNYFVHHNLDILNSAIQHKSTVNGFYFARNFDGYSEYVAAQADSAMRNPSEDCLFVLVDGMPEASSDLYQTLDIQQIGHYVVGTKKRVPANSPASIVKHETLQPDE